MNIKSGLVIITLLSAFFFCSFIVAASLSPLADLGSAANTFNSFGMWAAIGSILAFYIPPLTLYIFVVDSMRFVMSVFCGFGLVIHTALFVFIIAIGSIEGIISDLRGVLGICAAMFITNVVWFFVAFRSSKLDAQKSGIVAHSYNSEHN